MRISTAAAAATLLATLALPAAAFAEDLGLCNGIPIVEELSAPSAAALSCSIAPGDVFVTSSYYQNASRVGGTALAAYPLVAIDAGAARRIDFQFDAPSQIAESGQRGRGVFPHSRPGFAARYEVAQSDRLRIFSNVTVDQPASPFVTSQAQSPVALGMNGTYRLSPGVTLAGLVDAATPHRAPQFEPGALPSERLGASFSPGTDTLLWTDLGQRDVESRHRAQRFTDVSVDRLLVRNLSVDLGLGTAMNPVAGEKAHYLSSGLTFRP